MVTDCVTWGANVVRCFSCYNTQCFLVIRFYLFQYGLLFLCNLLKFSFLHSVYFIAQFSVKHENKENSGSPPKAVGPLATSTYTNFPNLQKLVRFYAKISVRFYAKIIDKPWNRACGHFSKNYTRLGVKAQNLGRFTLHQQPRNPGSALSRLDRLLPIGHRAKGGPALRLIPAYVNLHFQSKLLV